MTEYFRPVVVSERVGYHTFQARRYRALATHECSPYWRAQYVQWQRQHEQDAAEWRERLPRPSLTPREAYTLAYRQRRILSGSRYSHYASEFQVGADTDAQLRLCHTAAWTAAYLSERARDVRDPFAVTLRLRAVMRGHKFRSPVC